MDRGRAAGVVGLVVLGAVLSACAVPGPSPSQDAPATSSSTTTAVSAAPTPSSSSAPPTTAEATTPPAGPGTAAAVLATLAVKGRAPLTGYDRDLFGQTWADVDRNGCDTRNDVLRRDLTATELKPGTRGCVVLAGVLDDPYTGTTIAFTRGQDTSEAVQVDHVVALADAWQKGAQSWDLDRRTAFANDPLGLLAVDGPTNQAKGAGDAATWLPPQRAYRCEYVARQVAVKARYELWVTPAERDAISTVLATCPGQPLPTGGTDPADLPADPAPSPTTRPAPSMAQPAPAAGADPVTLPFPNCAAARAAGAAPVLRGTPGYQPKLDGDGDGVGCE
ncbi:DUF1524 domain-containing protein [Rhodococcus aerolatus]